MTEVHSPAQRLRDSIKTRLDRRYPRNERVEAVEAELVSLSKVVEGIESDMKSQSELLAFAIKRIDSMEDATRDAVRRLDDLIVATSPAVDFATESLPSLRERVTEANRLANESAVAIETILQQEVLIRRDLNCLLDQY